MTLLHRCPACAQRLYTEFQCVALTWSIALGLAGNVDCLLDEMIQLRVSAIEAHEEEPDAHDTDMEMS